MLSALASTPGGEKVLYESDCCSYQASVYIYMCIISNVIPESLDICPSASP